MIQKTDADGYVTEYGYDPRNLVESINYSDEKNVTFQYNVNGELTVMTDWNGTVSFALNILGRTESVNDQNGKMTHKEAQQHSLSIDKSLALFMATIKVREGKLNNFLLFNNDAVETWFKDSMIIRE